MVSRDRQDSETILQAWFGSPLKTLITVGGFLGFAFIGYSTLGETNRSDSDADQIRDAATQSPTMADRAARLRPSRPDEPIRCGVTVDCRSRQAVIRELARVGTLLQSRGNPYWAICAAMIDDIKTSDQVVWQLRDDLEDEAARVVGVWLDTCNAALESRP